MCMCRVSVYVYRHMNVCSYCCIASCSSVSSPDGCSSNYDRTAIAAHNDDAFNHHDNGICDESSHHDIIDSTLKCVTLVIIVILLVQI